MLLVRTTSSRASVSLIALSFLVSFLYSYLLSQTDRGLPVFDWFNVAIHIIWICVLGSIAWGVHQREPSAKSTLLFLVGLTFLLTGFDVFEEDSSLPLAAVSLLESILLFGAYICFPEIKVDKGARD